MGVLMGCVTSKRPPDAAACLKNMRCPAAYVRRATKGSQGASDVSCRLPSPARAADQAFQPLFGRCACGDASSALIASAASRGEGARQTGRPTTMWSTPAAMALAGVAMRF